ncbi:MAG TPA: DUF1442 domain-containing protein [Thermomicrobiales bacterium]|nr:DUF1442 domain-containing protein [Thermomicrobiales bacterium]
MNPGVSAVLDRLYQADAAQPEAGLGRDQRTRNVDRDTGRFLRLLVMTMHARRILEIGSSNAVSTIWLASAASELQGEVIGTEILPARAEEANANLSEAGLSGVATVFVGDAREIVQSFEGLFDFVFIDAEKEDYADHFHAVVDRVRERGVVLADNVISHDLSTYQRVLAARDDIETVTLPIGRGLELAVKR